MREEKTSGNQKQPYKKPRLRIIELTAEEVLAVGCKTASGGAAPVKAPPCAIHHCAKIGS